MDSRASTSTSTLTACSKPGSLIIDTTLTPMPSSSSFPAFRPSPLNPKSPPPSPTRAKRTHTFPASRPLRPFPSIVSMTNPKHAVSVVDDTPSGYAGEPSPAPAKIAPKTIEISSKWRGGFFVLGMTQAEFSRQD